MINRREVRWRKADCASGNCVEVARLGDHYLVRDSKVPDGAVLSFSEAEWEAFVEGVKAGDFSFG